MSDKRYKIVGEPGDYQVMEQFGAYRLSKKRCKTIEAAIKHMHKFERMTKREFTADIKK